MTDFKQLLINEDCFYEQTTIHGIDCSIGYIKEFRWSWLANQLNLFIIIGQTEQKIDKTLIEEFSKKSFEYALKNNKGWPRGFQSMVSSIAILQGNEIENDAMLFCMQASKKHWAAIEIPVLYDSNQKVAIKYNSAPMWGAVFFPFLTKKIEEITSRF